MDHNLEDSLNLESAIGEMDFEHAGDVVVSQADITLDTGTHDEEIPMEFENMEEQPMLMDTGKEEIIVSDFMSDQFSLQEYSVQDDQTTTATITEESNQQSVLTSQSDPLINLQFDSQTVVPIKKETQIQPKYIAVKAAPMRAAKKLEASLVAAAPRQVAIAPKPAAPAALLGAAQRLPRLPLAGVLHAPAAHSNTVLAQIGKRLVVMPSGHQKIKLVTSGSGSVQYIKANTSQGQLITAKSGLQGAKPIMAKVMVQGQSNADLTNQQTVITKILPSTSATTPQARYVMQQKTVPISLGQKVLLASPTKQGVKFTKKQQIISIKSPTPKLMPAPAQGTTTKKVVITANPAQNVILKTTAPPKAAQITKDGKVVVQGQRSQLHQINVPGKGIQYIRLITNQPSDTKTVTVNKPQPTATTLASKSFLLTDSKGQQKLVRIAPAPVKSSTVTPATSRASQSLLAPLSPLTSAVKLEDTSTDSAPAADELTEEETEMEERSEAEEYGRGARAERALHALVADAVAGPRDGQLYDQPESPEQDENPDGIEHLESGENLEEQLIVIPPNYIKSDVSAQDGYRQEESEGLENMLSMDAEENSYLTPRSPQAADCDVITSELGLRPRRACNCTKSQCLKLYCDCFANGEFCNRCNCNNCYNNLNYEELRQKAIRTCLERNPNAFRPKIGKSKTGGPDIIRRHNKGCNCKRSGCLKNYCECYEAKIACTAMCKCFGCRNVEETLHRARRREPLPHPLYRPPPIVDLKQPCSFMTTEVIEAVCQCLIAASVDGGGADKPPDVEPDPVRDVIDEFSRCLQDIISASHQAGPLSMLDEGHT